MRGRLCRNNKLSLLLLQAMMINRRSTRKLMEDNFITCSLCWQNAIIFANCMEIGMPSQGKTDRQKRLQPVTIILITRNLLPNEITANGTIPPNVECIFIKKDTKWFATENMCKKTVQNATKLVKCSRLEHSRERHC